MSSMQLLILLHHKLLSLIIFFILLLILLWLWCLINRNFIIYMMRDISLLNAMTCRVYRRRYGNWTYFYWRVIVMDQERLWWGWHEFWFTHWFLHLHFCRGQIGDVRWDLLDRWMDVNVVVLTIVLSYLIRLILRT